MNHSDETPIPGPPPLPTQVSPPPTRVREDKTVRELLLEQLHMLDGFAKWRSTIDDRLDEIARLIGLTQDEQDRVDALTERVVILEGGRPPVSNGHVDG